MSHEESASRQIVREFFDEMEERGKVLTCDSCGERHVGAEPLDECTECNTGVLYR